jgi:hypothetical protein
VGLEENTLNFLVSKLLSLIFETYKISKVLEKNNKDKNKDLSVLFVVTREKYKCM